MVEIRRPIFVVGENPGLTLYTPGTDDVVAVASYWHCVASPWGIGHVLVLWLDPVIMAAPSAVGQGGIWTDNFDLARGLVESLVQHFNEFQDIPLTPLAYRAAPCQHSFDRDRYRVVCQAAGIQITLAWGKILDWKQVVWPRFPAGSAAYDLTTTICPCEEAQIAVDGVALAGQVRLAQTAEGTTASSAFLAFAETWIGPLTPDQTETNE
jgi:hypothetical protein